MLSKKDKDILNAIFQGKDITFIIVNYNTDSEHVERLTEMLEKAKKSIKPPAKYYLAPDSCYITYNGRELTKNVSPMYNGGRPAEKHWLDIERKALLCNTEAFSSMWRVKEEMFIQLSQYFLRTPQALMQEYYKLWRNPKQIERLRRLFNNP